MSIESLKTELQNRMDCVQADYERLIEAGANRASLERVIKHSLEIGVIKDKLENIRIHELLRDDQKCKSTKSTSDKPRRSAKSNTRKIESRFSEGSQS